jgi:diaminohydroxyphosphoribosylaminopyrimidine deaminase/5-amino-6-(5-phosphoribosylamino)uracil reductase
VTPQSDLELIAMRRALAEARRGEGFVEPNPMVGAVLIRDGKILAAGYHARFGGPHAEIAALEAAGEEAKGATLVVTLEPCCHFGKTPPCADAVIRAGVRRVVAAMRDPFPRVSGGGFDRLRASGIEVEVGLLESAARALNAPFLKRVHTGRPFVTAKWAMTLDGKTATASGDSRWISNARSRSLVHETRGRVDGVLVGIGTALADNPALTARPPGPRAAARIVLDSRGRLPLGGVLVQTAGELPVIVAVTEHAPAESIAMLQDAGCTVLSFGGGQVPIGPLLDELGRRGMTNLLVEGGGRVQGAFLDAGEVDAVDVFIAPRIAGGSPHFVPAWGEGVGLMAHAWGLDRPEVSMIDEDIRVRGMLHRPWRDL